jgi:hypothetical protein
MQTFLLVVKGVQLKTQMSLYIMSFGGLPLKSSTHLPAKQAYLLVLAVCCSTVEWNLSYILAIAAKDRVGC